MDHFTAAVRVSVRSLKRHDWRSENGATATEYALLVGFIALVIAFGIAAFGTALDGFWGSIGAAVDALL